MTQKKAESGKPPTVPFSAAAVASSEDRTMTNKRLAWAWLVAAVGNGIESLSLIVLALMAAYGVISGGASTTTRALTEAVSLLVLGFGVGFLALNLLRHKSLAKTPTLLWNAILFLLSFSLIQGGAPLVGAATIVVSVVTFIAALLVPRFELDDDVLM